VIGLLWQCLGPHAYNVKTGLVEMGLICGCSSLKQEKALPRTEDT